VNSRFPKVDALSCPKSIKPAGDTFVEMDEVEVECGRSEAGWREEEVLFPKGRFAKEGSWRLWESCLDATGDPVLSLRCRVEG